MKLPKPTCADCGKLLARLNCYSKGNRRKIRRCRECSIKYNNSWVKKI